jgi:hypothetical protein
MYQKKISYEEAHYMVKKQRSIISPNHGFQTQLREYEKKLKEERVESSVRMLKTQNKDLIA